jgi:transcriptional regulator with PAS, ATPase and Fis domain
MLRLQKVCAEVVQGVDRGATLELGSRPVVVGRAPTCDLILTDPAVSATHVELSLEPAGVVVRNLGSRNGVHAGGARIQEGLVEVPGVLLVGRSVLRLEAVAEHAEIPFAPVRHLGDLYGSSMRMKIVFGLLRQYAASDSPVLIDGETGTGKELAAQAIHTLSARAGASYEILDCGAIPDNLIEPELFGVTRGAYTGADVPRPGVFERASGGTVVLDEIGELPLALQPALLGVLERKEVRRLGDQRPRRVSARVVATTNRVLAREVAAGRFRQDLYFRLSVLRVTLPPLRERREDIPLLVEQLLGPQHSLSPSWMRALADYDWPGNVRELRNMLERIRAQARPGAESVPSNLFGDTSLLTDLESARRCFERQYLHALLAKASYNVARAARLAGITRQGLYRLLHRNRVPLGTASPGPESERDRGRGE